MIESPSFVLFGRVMVITLKHNKHRADSFGVKSVSHSVGKNVKRDPIFAFHRKVESAFGKLLEIQIRENSIRSELSESMDESELDRFFRILSRSLNSLQHCPNDLWHYKERAKKED